MFQVANAKDLDVGLDGFCLTGVICPPKGL